jgi:archaellum component FlaC
MNILDKEYKCGVKDELTALEKRMNEGFQAQSKQYNDLKGDFNGLRGEFHDLKEEFRELRSDLEVELSGMRSDLRVEIKDSKVDTIRWTIALFLTLVAMIIAVYLKK